MSRWIDIENDEFKIEIADMDRCKHEYNETCCNAECPYATCYCPQTEFPQACKFFTEEDGVIDPVS